MPVEHEERENLTVEVEQFAVCDTRLPFVKNAYPIRHDGGGGQPSVTVEPVWDTIVTERPDDEAANKRKLEASVAAFGATFLELEPQPESMNPATTSSAPDNPKATRRALRNRERITPPTCTRSSSSLPHQR